MWAFTKNAGWILGTALGVFFGAEAVKGWFLGDVTPVLASFAGWPLYLALSVACVLSLITATWYVGTKCIKHVRVKRHLRLYSERVEAKNAVKKIKEFCTLLADRWKLKKKIKRPARIRALLRKVAKIEYGTK